MGITIAGTARHAAAVMRNFDCFGAPLAGIVSMHRDLGPADAVSVGMYLQTLILKFIACKGRVFLWFASYLPLAGSVLGSIFTPTTPGQLQARLVG